MAGSRPPSPRSGKAGLPGAMTPRKLPSGNPGAARGLTRQNGRQTAGTPRVPEGSPGVESMRPSDPAPSGGSFTGAICGRSAPCEISCATSRPWCKACQKRRARCAGCGQVELIRGGTLTTPLCAACARPGLSFWRGCPACGHLQLSTRSCTRCNLRQRLRALLAGHDGDVRAELRGQTDTASARVHGPGECLAAWSRPGRRGGHRAG
jgi:hypothetical protein